MEILSVGKSQSLSRLMNKNKQPYLHKKKSLECYFLAIFGSVFFLYLKKVIIKIKIKIEHNHIYFYTH